MIYDTIPNVPEENKIIDNYVDDVKSKDRNNSKNHIFKDQIQRNVFGKNQSKEKISKIEQSKNINVNSQKISKNCKNSLENNSINQSQQEGLRANTVKITSKNNIIESEMTNSDKKSKD